MLNYEAGPTTFFVFYYNKVLPLFNTKNTMGYALVLL